MAVATALAQSTEATVALEPGGMVVMGLSIAIVCGLTLFCIMHLVREKSPGEHHHAPLDIEAHDITH